MKRVMLYFGSFNPVHRGHIALAEYVVGLGICDEAVLVVSPLVFVSSAGAAFCAHAAIAAIIAIASKIANTFFISVPPLFFS